MEHDFFNNPKEVYMNRKEVVCLVEKVLDDFYKKHAYLVNNYKALSEMMKNNRASDKNYVCERSCVFRIGIYLNEYLSNIDECSDLNVDCEYCRNFDDFKRIYGRNHGVVPDIIVHRRASNKDNFLYFEFKGYWNTDEKDDIHKIKEFTRNDGEYNYKYGFFIRLGKSRNDCDVRLYIDGKEY